MQGKVKRWVGLALTVSAFILLVPGILMPMLTIKASISMMGFTMELMDETRSIMQTISALYEKQYYLVGTLILLFSVIIPAFKAGCLALRLLHLSGRLDGLLAKIILIISKWSMADVFVMGVWVAYLSAQATGQLQAALHEGFYCFLGYCLLSICALYCLDESPQKQAQPDVAAPSIAT